MWFDEVRVLKDEIRGEGGLKYTRNLKIVC